MLTLRLLFVPLLLLGAVVQAEIPAAPVPPEDVVRQTSSDLLTIIEEGKTYIDEDPERFYRAVHDVLDPTVDFPRFARGVMGTYWKRATEEQQDRFVEVFKWGLLRTYAAALTEFGDGEVVVLDPEVNPKKPKRRTVVMEIRTSGGDVYPVDYSMGLGKDGAWKIRNLKVGGVNIGLTYRSQFQSAAKDPKYGRDLDKVIDAWATVLEEEAEKQEAEAQQAEAAGDA